MTSIERLGLYTKMRQCCALLGFVVQIPTDLQEKITEELKKRGIDDWVDCSLTAYNEYERYCEEVHEREVRNGR